MIARKLTRLLVLAALIVGPLGCATRTSSADTQASQGVEAVDASASEKEAGSAQTSLRNVRVYFKLDPRITRGMYMGDRWVSPPTYAPGPQKGEEYTLEARVQGLNSWGNTIRLESEWSPADPEMVSVSPRRGAEVTLTVRQAGQSAVKVVARGIVRELSIKATDGDYGLQVEIAQGMD